MLGVRFALASQDDSRILTSSIGSDPSELAIKPITKYSGKPH